MTHLTTIYVSCRGLGALRTRLESARAAYKSVCDDNPAARESGDSSVWHDNFAFEENQRLMHQLGSRIRELENALVHAVLVSLPDEAPREAVIGTCVHYTVDGENEPRSCTLVGHGEGRPDIRCVAYDSPLGASLLGARLGDEVEVRLRGRSELATIVALERAAPELFLEDPVSTHETDEVQT